MPDSVDEMYQAIRDTVTRRGNVVIPTFALERTQEILYYLHRGIRDGAASVRVFNEEIPVRAQMWTINGFSAHADQPSLLAWLDDVPRRKVFLVHGEYDRGMRACGHAGIAGCADGARGGKSTTRHA